jgi:NADH-quinone oxidoreductase subunit N
MAFFQSQMFLTILPEFGMLVLAGLLLTLSLLKNERVNCCLGRVTAIGSALIVVLAFIFSRPGTDPIFLWGGMLRLDSAGFLFRILFLVGVSLTSIFAETEGLVKNRPEFYAMLVFSAIGMSFMASAGDLIMLFLAIEIASIPLYVLAGVKVNHEHSVEAGIKYLLFGGLASAIMVFGFSILYGMGGTTRIDHIYAAVKAANVPIAGLVGAVLFVLAGFTFKISAVPYHWWAPDVYEGAPTPVTGFLSTASKAAGFAIMLRLMAILFGAEHAFIWQLLIAVIAIASMFGGNLVAIPQKNFKRLLAYSSIAQAGYMLVGVAAGTTFGYTAVVYYLMVYLLTNLMLFALIGWVERSAGNAELGSFSGLQKRSPLAALAILIGLLSLGGIPPFGGFFAKLLVFGAAIDSNLEWLAVIGIINSVISLYYYLRVLKLMYVDEPQKEFTLERISLQWKVTLVVCVVAVIVLGVVLSPWFGFASTAAGGI